MHPEVLEDSKALSTSVPLIKKTDRRDKTVGGSNVLYSLRTKQRHQEFLKEVKTSFRFPIAQDLSLYPLLRASAKCLA